MKRFLIMLLMVGCAQQLPTPGAPGKDGTNGKDGTAGTNGINGQNGSVVTFVKFCPQVTSYPSVFVEVGLCIDGELFAVYSVNNGFGVKLETGNYSSHAIGSACSFSVQPGCVVVPQ